MRAVAGHDIADEAFARLSRTAPLLDASRRRILQISAEQRSTPKADAKPYQRRVNKPFRHIVPRWYKAVPAVISSALPKGVDMDTN